MKFFSSLALLVSAVAANPILRTRDTPKNFHLKTTGADNSAHNDLYVYGYHTGAGFNDAVLTSDVGTASPAFLNGTNVQFSLDTPFPWGLVMRPQNNYGGKLPPPPLALTSGQRNIGLTYPQRGSRSRSTLGMVAVVSPSTMTAWSGRNSRDSVAGWVSFHL